MLADAQLLRTAKHPQHGAQVEAAAAAAAAATASPDNAIQSSGDAAVASSSLVATAARPDIVVLDVRNDYEWDAGHFQGAQRPQEVCVALL